jgi:hypothetical protein
MCQESWKYTSKLQKGGALLTDMRELVRTWQDAPLDEQRSAGLRSNILNKATRARLADVYQRAFIPRFLRGPIPDAWKLVRPLEDLRAPLWLVRPVYYWITARSEPLLADFCREVLYPEDVRPTGEFGAERVMDWFRSKNCPWTPVVAAKVARGLVAALRDFGILEGRARKRISSASLPPAAFAYVAFCLHLQGSAGSVLVSHPDWQLFLLSPEQVEYHFLLAHQHKYVDYYAAGSVVEIRFPASTPKEYAHVVTR